MLQTLHLEMSTSAAYAQPSVMIDGPALWNGTHGSTLRTPPQTAITNVDIPTQCIYQIPGAEKGTFQFRPARGIVNRLMRELGPMNAQAPQFPLAAAAPAPLRARAESLGNGDFSPLWAGQNASGCREDRRG